MPLYDYEFLKPDGSPSGEVVEVMQRMSDATLTAIDGRPVRKLVTGARIERAWHGAETTSREIVFDGSREAAENVKRDCPSMELAVDPRTGWQKPVFRSDRHHRKCMKEFTAAIDREDQRQAIEREARPMALIDASDAGELEEVSDE